MFGSPTENTVGRKSVMKAWSVIGLLFAAGIFATIPISAQVTPRGLELSVDGAKAITYGHARRVQRRGGGRRVPRPRPAVRRGCSSFSEAHPPTPETAGAILDALPSALGS